MTPATAAARRASAAPARHSPTRPRKTPPRRAPSRPGRSRPAYRRAGSAPMPARLFPLAVGRTAGAVSGLAESGLVRRLTRGRLWIGALTTLLVGIGALNVLALSFNATASRAGQQADVLERDISPLRAQIAAAGASTERVQAEARRLGLVIPEPGAIAYLRSRPDDAATAAKRLAAGELSTAPSAPAAPAPTVPAATTAPPTTTVLPTTTTPAAPAATGAPPTAPTADPIAGASSTTAATPAPAAPPTATGGGVGTP